MVNRSGLSEMNRSDDGPRQNEIIRASANGHVRWKWIECDYYVSHIYSGRAFLDFPIAKLNLFMTDISLFGQCEERDLTGRP